MTIAEKFWRDIGDKGIDRAQSDGTKGEAAWPPVYLTDNPDHNGFLVIIPSSPLRVPSSFMVNTISPSPGLRIVSLLPSTL